MNLEKVIKKYIYRFVLHKRFIFLVLPLLVYFAFIALLWIIYPPTTNIFDIHNPSNEFSKFMGGLFLYLVPPAGKETIAPLLVGLHYPLYLVFISIVLMDAVVSFIIAFNFDLLERVPYLNKLIYKIETSAKALLEKRPFIMKSSYLAMFILMCTPFQGCGATTLTIVGKLLGMSYKVVFNILLFGSILSTLSYICLFKIVKWVWFSQGPYITILCCLILFTAIGFVTYIVNEKFHLRQVKPIYTILTGIFVILSVLMGILLLYMYFRAN